MRAPSSAACSSNCILRRLRVGSVDIMLAVPTTAAVPFFSGCLPARYSLEKLWKSVLNSSPRAGLRKCVRPGSIATALRPVLAGVAAEHERGALVVQAPERLRGGVVAHPLQSGRVLEARALRVDLEQ